jgi:acetylxylan esterase
MQIYHGGNDKTLFPQNYNETIKQWCGIFGYEYSKPVSSKKDVPSGGYVLTQWGSNLEGLYSPVVGHSVPIFGAKDMEWFGLG